MNLFDDDDTPAPCAEPMEICFGSGNAFKTIFDFLAAAFQQADKSAQSSQADNCWMYTGPEGIHISDTIQDKDGIVVYLQLFLDPAKFSTYTVHKGVRVCLNPKKIKGLVNSTKNDYISLLGGKEEGSIQLKIVNVDRDTIDIKTIKTKSVFAYDGNVEDDCAIETKPMLVMDSTKFSNLKKSIGCTRDSICKLKVGSDYLSVDYLANGDSPATRIMGGKMEIPTDVLVLSVSGICINILAKFTQLCPKVEFYKINESTIRIQGEITKPGLAGAIKLTIRNYNK